MKHRARHAEQKPLTVRLSALATACALLSAGITYTVTRHSSPPATCKSIGNGERNNSHAQETLPLTDQALNLSSMIVLALNMSESVGDPSGKSESGHEADITVQLGRHRGFIQLTETSSGLQPDPNFEPSPSTQPTPWYEREPNPLLVTDIDASRQRPRWGDLTWVNISVEANGGMKIISVLNHLRSGADQLNIVDSRNMLSETGYRIRSDGSERRLFTEHCPSAILGDEERALQAASRMVGLATARLEGPPAQPGQTPPTSLDQILAK